VDNGAYGIYPVQTENTLIDSVVAIGASDAGIYVGQSKNVVVKNSRAEYNVAGIEIENTVDADVFDNVATNNTGGILVFNMPNLSQEGARTRVFQNQVFGNNTENFAIPGGAVAGVPAGSGILINSNDDVEIFDNDLADNDTAHIIISSVYSTNYASRETAEGFDPYPERIFIHGNRYEGGGTSPDMLELKVLKTAMFGLTGAFPHVVWDGYLNESLAVDGALAPERNICIKDEAETELLNVDGPNGYNNPRVERDRHLCEHERLAPVTLSIGE
jgi:parallel beta-helix repeat protein